ncbi:hypothetical protein D0T49_09925 [Paludibacter sp. 221]|uniref:hypothetical protein n=1 Tax=Paludibacter sp. 221 TaxID=2302939 RepID=UPI0013D30B7A|nr:hypothetical protein [Paludibacter sp. 221]NDV47362.1 hypothetical protein [Paludibacter sp. 221]
MENINPEKIETNEIGQISLKINYVGETLLKSAAQWGQFIAVINFISIGFLAVVSILMIFLSSTLQEYQDFGEYPIAIIGVAYLVMSIIYFFPTYFLSRACSRAKDAILKRDENILAKAFESLKNLSLFTGVMIILSLLFIVFMIVIMVFFIGTLAAFM